jgi:hypothetical protein
MEQKYTFELLILCWVTSLTELYGRQCWDGWLSCFDGWLMWMTSFDGLCLVLDSTSVACWSSWIVDENCLCDLEFAGCWFVDGCRLCWWRIGIEWLGVIALNRSPYMCCCVLCVSGFGLCACGSLWLFATAVCVCRSETVLCCLGAARVIGSPVWDSLMSLVVMRLYISFLWDWLISKL